MGLSTVGGGLTSSKLQLANAAPSDVISGKKFYAGDKTLKTGTIPDNGAWSGTYSGNNVTIPYGKHSGSGAVGVAGGNRGSWGTTIDPGSSVAIPQGYHNGQGRVYANSERFATATLKSYARGDEYESGSDSVTVSGTIIYCPTGTIASGYESGGYIKITGYSGNTIYYDWYAHGESLSITLVVGIR